MCIPVTKLTHLQSKSFCNLLLPSKTGLAKHCMILNHSEPLGIFFWSSTSQLFRRPDWPDWGYPHEVWRYFGFGASLCVGPKFAGWDLCLHSLQAEKNHLRSLGTQCFFGTETSLEMLAKWHSQGSYSKLFHMIIPRSQKGKLVIVKAGKQRSGSKNELKMVNVLGAKEPITKRSMPHGPLNFRSWPLLCWFTEILIPIRNPIQTYTNHQLHCNSATLKYI